MLIQTSKNVTRRRVHKRIRKKVMGTAERPRLNVYRSLNNIYVQVIDDLQGVTLVSANSAEGKKAGSEKSEPKKTASDRVEGAEGKEGKKEARVTGGNLASAKAVGKSIAERAKAKGISKVVFDRGGYIYHGRVKALADAAREAGLQF
jgi:large subunit ribosomal protein L18